MSNWIATTELRFVEREVWVKTERMPEHYHMVRILQQKWENKDMDAKTWDGESNVEWRDVPVVEEE